MARIPLSKVRVEVEGKEPVEYLATNTPNKSKAGNVLFGCVNYKGMAEFQKHGILLTNEESYRDMMKQIFPFLTDDMIGERGEDWDTADARSKIKVFINDVPYNPAFGKTKEEKEELVTPKISVPALDLSSIAAPLEITPIVAAVDKTAIAAAADKTE